MNIKGKLITLTVFVASLIVSACSAPEGLKPIQPSEIRTYKSTGVIKKVDAETGKLTLDHEDIPGYMAAMEMTESVKDRSSLSGVKVGDRVDFEIERTGASIIISKITKIGEVAVVSGLEVYKTNCSECHGENGTGTKKGISLISGHALHHSRAEHIKQVTDGKRDKMPAFRDKLSPGQIDAVVEYIREDLQKGAGGGEHKH
ncbi:MAG: copper-binding protein [Acidobacteria bacterium]|nr:copper-binding protein [Acidobacteriota bacterium]MBK8148775.1 copper-binding protein [Acidobacteriota bacterium]MBK8810178.1 copper-binding protein [Acidobacteriota bacterium]